MSDDEDLSKIEQGLMNLLVRFAEDGNAQAASSALSHIDKNKKPKPKRRRFSKKHSTLTREEYLVLSLAQIESAVAEATDSSSWQAVVNGKRLAVQLREELDEHRKTNQTTDLSPEEAEKRMIEAMKDWPDELLERALDIYCDRQKCTFFLSRDGQKPVERIEGGWRAVK